MNIYQKYTKCSVKSHMYLIYFQLHYTNSYNNNISTLFQTIADRVINRKNYYCTRVNLRLKPKLVFEVGKVLATNGFVIL